MERTRQLIVCLALVVHTLAVTRPPGIIDQPPENVFYKAGETVMLPCVAEAAPNPQYLWKRNGIDFNPSGNSIRVVQLANVGTIVLTKPESKDEGIFQCFAHNAFGTSLTIRANLREAKLKSFPIKADTIMRPRLGHNLTLGCVPPESIPPAHVFWVIKDTYGRWTAVNYDDRVTMDIEYRLRFTNVLASDYQDGNAYACMANNAFMRRSSMGPQFFINPERNSADEAVPATYMWTSPEDHFGLRGDNFTVKCIYYGNPTPDIHWERTRGSIPDRAQVRSFGQSLYIENLQFEDAGVYECWGTNDKQHARQQRTISIRVESRPFFLAEPEDVEVRVGGSAEFNCVAKANPEPKYEWFINGVPLGSVNDTRINPSRFRHPRPDRIVFVDLTRADSMVVQCNATNKHGYVWGDAYLNVLSEAPTIIQPPENRKIVAEGMSINLTCRVTGQPDPIITWYKDHQQITGGRYRIQPKGDLFFKSVVLADAGLYRCEAENEFNRTSAQGLLVVRRKTLIERAPKDLEAFAGTDAKFTCSGTTDPEEVSGLEIRWQKDRKDITEDVQRMFKNYQDNSLTISGTIVRDSGTYTCIATNGLDFSEASAMLTVRDKPEQASKVTHENCNLGNVTVQWTPGSYNNAPVQYYIIQYNTTFAPDTWTFIARVDNIYNIATVPLSPWVTYTFRVIAYNKIGESNPSAPSTGRQGGACTTQDSTPDKSPTNVRTIGDRPDYVHIEWTPMPEYEHNGNGFHYELEIEREGYDERNAGISIEWQVYEYFYPAGGLVYEPFKIKLKAINVKGPSKANAQYIRGFSGEGTPLVTCTGPHAEEIGDTYAVLKWQFDYTQVNATGTGLQGEFRGFKIQFWQQGYRQNSLREWNIQPEDALASRVGDVFSASVGNLLPNTNMECTIAVMNNYYVSQPSDVFHFVTSPGLPGPVELFRPINIGDNHVNLEWKPPMEQRGDLLGYDIGYQSVHGLDLGEMQVREPQINDAYATTAMLSGLLSKTRYRVHIWARTLRGRGESYFIELVTSHKGDPQAPRFSIADVGQHNINVSWWINPYASSGTIVYVEYRKEDDTEWLRTIDEVISTWKNISNLEAGTTYEVRVVATTGGVRQASSVEEVTTDGVAVAFALIGNYGWFVGMLLSLLLLVGLLAFLIVVFRKGKRFKRSGSRTSSEDGSYSGTYGHNTARFPKHSTESVNKPSGHLNVLYGDKDDDFDDEHPRNGSSRKYNDEKYPGEDDDDEYGFDDRQNSDRDRHYDDDRRDDDHYDDDRRRRYSRDYDDDGRHYDEGRNYDDGRHNSRDYDDDYPRGDHGDTRQRGNDVDARQRRHDNSRRQDDDDRRRRDYDDDHHDVDDDRSRSHSYSDIGGNYRADTSDDHVYESYGRKPSSNYDPDHDDRDYREPSRFDRHGVPVDVPRKSGSPKAAAAADPVASTFV